MTLHAPVAAIGVLRPQLFGRRDARRIADPIIEPLWIGERVLARVTAGTVALTDANGRPRPGNSVEFDELMDALRTGLRAREATIDGYLSRQPTATPAPPPAEVSVPTAAELTSQLIVGMRSDRKRRLVADDRAIAAVEDADAPLAFVAVDLLEIDGESLLDVPLLERRRLLGSALEEGHLVRVGAFVRPPIDSWFGTWRALGFLEVAFKAANGRYRPGAVSDDWATARIPKR